MNNVYAYTGGRPFDAALPCVVFIHGALNDHSVWTLAARWFAHHGHSVLAIDLPGHGRSAGCRSLPAAWKRWPTRCWRCWPSGAWAAPRWWGTAWGH